MEERSPQKRGNTCIDEESVLTLQEEQMKEAGIEMETTLPIRVAEKSDQWALVASPNKPPAYP